MQLPCWLLHHLLFVRNSRMYNCSLFSDCGSLAHRSGNNGAAHTRIRRCPDAISNTCCQWAPGAQCSYKIRNKAMAAGLSGISRKKPA